MSFNLPMKPKRQYRKCARVLFLSSLVVFSGCSDDTSSTLSDVADFVESPDLVADQSTDETVDILADQNEVDATDGTTTSDTADSDGADGDELTDTADLENDQESETDGEADSIDETDADADTEADVETETTDTADDGDSADSTDVVIPPDPDTPFVSARVDPDIVFLGRETTVRFMATLPYDDLDAPPEVTLEQVDADGEFVSEVAELFDDGDPEHGDVTAGDQVFSFELTVTAADEGLDRYRARVGVDDDAEFSPIFALVRLESMTDEHVEALIASQEAAIALFEATEADDGTEAALAAVVASLEANELVALVEQPTDDPLLTLIYEPGIIATLNFLGDDVRSGDSPPAAASDEPGVESEHRIGTREAIVIAPYSTEFGDTDESAEVAEMLSDAACPSYDVTEVRDPAVTLDAFKGLDKYGVIVMVTHGELTTKYMFEHMVFMVGYRLGLDPFEFQRVVFPLVWRLVSEFDTVVLIKTGVRVRDIDMTVYQHDFLMGRIAFSNATVGILPGFIDTYSGQFEDSLVYIGACYSTHSNSMANTFLNKGASTYLGFDRVVASRWAKTVALELFEHFVDNVPEMIGEVFTPGQIDPNFEAIYAAEFEMIGAGDLRRPDPELRNGGFESGDFEYWDARQSGVCSVVEGFGPYEPTEGDYAGLITTFDPETISWNWLYGIRAQTICLPPGATSFEMDYNYMTQHCFRRTTDKFYVALGPARPVEVTAPGECDALEQLEDGLFPRSSPVYGSGWREVSFDLSELSSEDEYVPARLTMQATDTSDTGRDTVVIVDNIRILTE